MGGNRHLVAVLALISSVLLVLATTPHASAHGTTITFTIFGDGEGRVRAAGTWGKELHPVEEQMWVVMTATPVPADGTRTAVGPLVMLPVDEQTGVVQAPQFLDRGKWTVVVEASHPALGKGDAVIDVDGSASGFPETYTPPLPEPANAWSVWLWPLAVLALVGAALIVGRMRPGASPRRQQGRNPSKQEQLDTK